MFPAVASSSTSLSFAVVDRGEAAPQLPYPFVELRWDYWDDFSFKTSLYVTLHLGANNERSLGKVKLLKRDQEGGFTELPPRFEQLDSSYVSLGQDIEYYENLMALSRALRNDLLRAMRDAAADPNIEAGFSNETGWTTSLLRFGQAVNALEAGRNLLAGHLHQTGLLSFRFDWRRGARPTAIDFSFDGAGELPGRCQILIGYNGVGKTTLLADLAIAASRGRHTPPTNDDSTIAGADTTFGAVVAVSYSAFDTFRTPESVTSSQNRGTPTLLPDIEEPEGRTEVFGYVYCGLRRLTPDANKRPAYKLKSIDEIETEFTQALAAVGKRSESREHLVSAFRALSQEPSFGRAGVDLGHLGSGMDSIGALEAFQRLSTGHKIVLNIVTQLAAHLKTRSLVLIDEPETHLHPPLMAALLRAVQLLLRAHDSFAVIATHSPVVVQEIQSRYVKILERFVNDVSARDPEIETFGENIGTITRHVFSLDSSATDYQGILESLAQRYTVDQISAMFEHGISSQARALVVNYQTNS